MQCLQKKINYESKYNKLQFDIVNLIHRGKQTKAAPSPQKLAAKKSI